MTQVIVLNGGSSSGKSSIARGLVLEPDGTVTVLPTFRAIEDIWYQGLANMARHGAFLILDEVLLTGGAGQERLRGMLGGLDVLWAGVHCDPLVASDSVDGGLA